MGKIIISENITVDGVVEDPTGEDQSPSGGWFNRMSETDRAAWAQTAFTEASDAAALLLGRRSDTYFGSRWNNRTGAFADRLNSLPKYIVSSTINHTVWRNGTVISGHVDATVARLKQTVAGNIVVYASRTLVQVLLNFGLVDELRLTVFPCIAGGGKQLFEGTAPKTLRRIDVRSIGESLSRHIYSYDQTDA